VQETAIWSVGLCRLTHPSNPSVSGEDREVRDILTPLLLLTTSSDWSLHTVASSIGYAGPFPVPVNSGPLGVEAYKHLWWRRDLYDFEDDSRLHNRRQVLHAWQAYEQVFHGAGAETVHSEV
jgi:hypothetical protein